MIFCLFVQLDKFLYQNNYKYDINFTKPFSNKNIVKNKKKNENCNIIIIAYYIEIIYLINYNYIGIF